MSSLHLYLVAQGGYTSASTFLQPEIWQTGTRLRISLGSGTDPIGTIPDAEWDVVPANHSRVESDWTIDGNWSLEGGITDFDPADYLNDQAGVAWDAFMGTSTIIAQYVELRQLRLYPIASPDGRVEPAPPYAQGSPVVLNYTPAVPGVSATGTMLPPNCSTVASLRTAQLGRRGRGRMFMPCGMSGNEMGASGAQGTIASTYRTAFTNAVVSLMEGLAFDGDGGSLTVRPIVTGAPYTDYAIVNQIRCGNVVDAQVRRRRSIPEAYTSAAVSY